MPQNWQRRIKHARAQPGFDLFGRRTGGDDSGQHGAIAIVEQLEELLFGPGRGAFSAQIIQHQHR